MKAGKMFAAESAVGMLCSMCVITSLWECVDSYIGAVSGGMRAAFNVCLYISVFMYLVFLRRGGGADARALAAVAVSGVYCAAVPAPPAARFCFASALTAVYILCVLPKPDKAMEDKSSEGYDRLNIEERYMRSRELWHDMRNHINLLNLYIERGDYEGMREYTAGFADSIERTILPYRTGNMAVDMILGDKLYCAKKHNIVTEVSLAPLDGLNVSNNDICVLLGNLLDNAVEACLKVDEGKRYIKIRIRRNGNVCYFCIENSCISYATEKTSKPNPERHGIGLRSAERIAHKYGGTLAHRGGNGKFIIAAELTDR